jgi:hypothetical protein
MCSRPSRYALHVAILFHFLRSDLRVSEERTEKYTKQNCVSVHHISANVYLHLFSLMTPETD